MFFFPLSGFYSSFRWGKQSLPDGTFFTGSKFILVLRATLDEYYYSERFQFLTASGIELILTWFPVKGLKTPNSSYKKLNSLGLIYLAFFMVPLLAVIQLHSVLYDPRRRLYFLSAPMVLLAAYALYIFTGQAIIS